jgi:hypothetical protein
VLDVPQRVPQNPTTFLARILAKEGPAFSRIYKLVFEFAGIRKVFAGIGVRKVRGIHHPRRRPE